MMWVACMQRRYCAQEHHAIFLYLHARVQASRAHTGSFLCWCWFVCAGIWHNNTPWIPRPGSIMPDDGSNSTYTVSYNELATLLLNTGKSTSIELMLSYLQIETGCLCRYRQRLLLLMMMMRAM
jgi:hypothetical protein